MNSTTSKNWLRTPSWKWNLLILALFAAAVVIYVSWQFQLNRDSFRRHALEHAQLISGIMARNAVQAGIAQEMYQDIIKAFLGSTADFVRSLDQIEPFKPAELSAFAWENGLTMISLKRPDGSLSSYPEQWPQQFSALQQPGLHLIEDLHLFIFLQQEQQYQVTLSLPSRKLEQLQQQLSQQHLLKLLSDLPGMAYVRTEAPGTEINSSPAIKMLELSDPPVAEARLVLPSGGILVVGLKAELYAQRMRALLYELGGLCALMLVVGGLLSRLLYRQQKMMVQHVQEFERQLARQHEDAALGRAADSISHEIRNPLNAISIGLQRIEMEALQLEPEHRELLQAMDRAVRRSNQIITQLQRYTRPLEPVSTAVDFGALIEQEVLLYRPLAQQQQISIDTALCDTIHLEADPQLLQQVIENLLKNALEAQPRGGEIKIRLEQQEQDRVLLQLTNQGASDISADQLDALFEPYVSSKTRGTGLGLPLVRKIVRAHQGTILLDKPQPDSFRVSISLPTTASQIPNSD